MHTHRETTTPTKPLTREERRKQRARRHREEQEAKRERAEFERVAGTGLAQVALTPEMLRAHAVKARGHWRLRVMRNQQPPRHY